MSRVLAVVATAGGLAARLGLPAVIAVAGVIAAAGAVLCWVLCSAERSERLAALIAATRGSPPPQARAARRRRDPAGRSPRGSGPATVPDRIQPTPERKGS